jgi:acetylornithine aminotransferase
MPNTDVPVTMGDEVWRIGALAEKLADRGVLVNAPNANTIRIAPALTVSKVQIDKFVTVFTQCILEVDRG